MNQGQFIENLWYFFEYFTLFNSATAIFTSIYLGIILLDFYLFIISIKAIYTQKINIRIRGAGVTKISGTEAVRIGYYYLIGAIIVFLFLLNMNLNFSISTQPFRVYQGKECIRYCE
jgi:hypothetical protein